MRRALNMTLLLLLALLLVSCQNPSRPLPLDALADLPSTCISDGEAVGCDANGVTSFNLVRIAAMMRACFSMRSI
jgi:hypothetical protein